MIDFLWKLGVYWTLYETFRYIAVYFIREEIRRIANTKSSCRRCQWRLFCTRSALYLRTRFASSNQKLGLTLIILGIALGNGDALWILLRKLLEERKQLNGRTKKNSLPGRGLQHGERFHVRVMHKMRTRFRKLFHS